MVSSLFCFTICSDKRNKHIKKGRTYTFPAMSGKRDGHFSPLPELHSSLTPLCYHQTMPTLPNWLAFAWSLISALEILMVPAFLFLSLSLPHKVTPLSVFLANVLSYSYLNPSHYDPWLNVTNGPCLKQQCCPPLITNFRPQTLHSYSTLEFHLSWISIVN